MLQMKKKGMITFGNAPKVLLSFGIMVMIAAAVVIALVGFRNGSTDATANTTITNGVTALSNFSAQLGTVGTMLGVGLLLLIVVGVFGFIGSKQGGL